jgi:hypothetical protein
VSRFDPDPPATVGEVNARLVALANELEQVQPVLEGLLADHQRVNLRYELEYAASVKGSQLGSEDRRKAEAVARLYETYLDDEPTKDLATRRAELDMRIKALREASHNIRASMNGLQTVAANIRAEMHLGSGVR